MLHQTGKLIDSDIISSDGVAGKVNDILFDNVTWICRYLVADLGAWFSGRMVLIPFKSIERSDENRREIVLSLTKEAIEQSPDVSTDNPISIEAELLLGKYWMWTTGSVARLPNAVGLNLSQEATVMEKQVVERATNSHLRSLHEVTGYHIEASDGEIGHLEDFVADSVQWDIRYLVVDTGNWLLDRRVLVPCTAIENIRWADRKAHVSLSRNAIKSSPEYSLHQLIAYDYEHTLQDHYVKQGIVVDAAPSMPTIASLMAMLGSKDSLERKKTREDLVDRGKPAVPFLMDALENSALNYVREEAVKALSRISDAESIPALIYALQDPDESIIWLAGEALIPFKKNAWLPLMRLLVKDGVDSASLREAAHHVLCNQHEEGFDDLLAPLLTALEAGSAPDATPGAAHKILKRLQAH